MRRSFPTIILLFIGSLAQAQLPVFEWAHECGNPPKTTDTRSTLAVNPQGGFYLAGEFIDQAQFGQKTLSAAGGTDGFLASHDQDGEVLWATRIGGTDYDYIHTVAVDGAGNIIITGFFYGTTQIGDDVYTSYGSQDIFVAKLSPDGTVIWSVRAGGPMADYVSGLGLDQEDNLLVSGFFYGEMAIGDTTLTAGASSAIFLAKIDGTGNLLWVNTAGGSSSDQSRSLAVDPQGNILLTGSFYYDITFQDTTLVTADPVGVFIARYLPDGSPDWVFQLNGSYLTPDVLLATDQNGNIFVSGNFSEEIHFGNKTFNAGEFNQDIFLAKYEPSSKLSWARHAWSVSSDQIIGLTTDIYNNVYLTGHYLDTMHFNLLTLPYSLCCGSREIFVVTYTAAGEALWAERISGTRANVHAIGMNEEGNLMLSGWFTEELLFGPLSLSNFSGFRNFVTGMSTEMFTRLQNPLKHGDFRVYPNPAGDFLRLSLPEGVDAVEVIISNMAGMIVYHKHLGRDEAITVKSISPGIYGIRATHPSLGIVFNSRFIRL